MAAKHSLNGFVLDCIAKWCGGGVRIDVTNLRASTKTVANECIWTGGHVAGVLHVWWSTLWGRGGGGGGYLFWWYICILQSCPHAVHGS